METDRDISEMNIFRVKFRIGSQERLHPSHIYSWISQNQWCIDGPHENFQPKHNQRKGRYGGKQETHSQ